MLTHLLLYLVAKFGIYFYSSIKLSFVNFSFFSNFSVLLFNLFVYIILLINLFTIFFIFDLNKIKTLNDLKLQNNINSISIWISVLLLSFAGVPPFLGFVSKFLIFISVFASKNIFVFFIFLTFNIVIIYFYIQNLRFITANKSSELFLKKNFEFKFNKKVIFFLNLLNCLNVVGILFFEDFFIFINFSVSNLFF